MQTVDSLKHIVTGPVQYAGGALITGRVFDYESATKSILIPNDLWIELSHLGYWVSQAVILQWAEKTISLGKGIDVASVVGLLLDKEDNVSDTTLYPVATQSEHSLEVQRVLRNTYALLAMTLIFSAAVASAAVAFRWPAPGLVLTLVGYFGLLFAIHRFQNSGWALPAVFALTGFMGYSLGPILTHYLAVPGGAQTISMALGATGVTFLSLSAYALTTRKDFSFMGSFLFMGMVIAMLAGLAALFFEIPALSLAVSGMVALLSAGLILFETSQIVNGGERNYVLATVSLFVSVFNLFTSLLALFGFGGNSE